MTERHAARDAVLRLVKRHGHNATCFQVLETGFRYWFDGDDACVAYVDTGRAWVAAGAPIAPLPRMPEVTARFVGAARARGRRACFFGVERRFLDAEAGATQPAMRSLLIGEQASWDPASWEETLRDTPSLREQLRRARAKGVSVRRVDPAEVRPGHAARKGMEAVEARWLLGHAMPPMGFLVDVQPFDRAEERRFWAAERDGAIVAFLVAVPIPARSGWLIEDLLRDPEAAPSGSAELLIDAAMRGLAAEGSRHVTLGLAPLSGEVHGWLRVLRDRSSLLYDFHGVRLFKAKLRPAAWEPIHLAHPDTHGAITALRDVLTAFARGSMLRFGLHAVLRGPTFVVAALAALLVPWTVALALAAPAEWFPAEWIRWAWVIFDAALAFGLFALARRWDHRLGTALAAIVTADAAITWAEALAWNVPRLRGPADAAIVAAGCLAPTLAAIILWHARAARSRAARSRADDPSADSAEAANSAQSASTGGADDGSPDAKRAS